MPGREVEADDGGVLGRGECVVRRHLHAIPALEEGVAQEGIHVLYTAAVFALTGRRRNRTKFG